MVLYTQILIFSLLYTRYIYIYIYIIYIRYIYIYIYTYTYIYIYIRSILIFDRVIFTWLIFFILKDIKNASNLAIPCGKIAKPIVHGIVLNASRVQYVKNAGMMYVNRSCLYINIIYWLRSYAYHFLTYH